MKKVEINMPRLGASMKKGDMLKWLVKEGDEVKKGDSLCEIQAEKMAADVESLYSGKVTELNAEIGETYDVGAVLGYIEVE